MTFKSHVVQRNVSVKIDIQAACIKNICMSIHMAKIEAREQERPYHDDSTASRLLSEVKHHRAWLVLRWGTTLESQVLFFYSFFRSKLLNVVYNMLKLTFKSHAVQRNASKILNHVKIVF